MVLLLLAASPVFAANVTLTYGECQTDSASGNVYCAPSDRSVNESQTYVQCISDFNAKYNELNSTCNSRIGGLEGRITNLSDVVSKVEGVTLTEEFVRCGIELNLTKDNVRILNEELVQRDGELKAASVGKVDESVFSQCQSDVSVLQGSIKTKEEDARNYGIVGFIIGGLIVYYLKVMRKSPKDDFDSRGGRPPKVGNR